MLQLLSCMASEEETISCFFLNEDCSFSLRASWGSFRTNGVSWNQRALCLGAVELLLCCLDCCSILAFTVPDVKLLTNFRGF